NKKISKPNKVDIAENNESSNAERDIADKTMLHYKLNQSSPTQQKIQGSNPVPPPTQQKIQGPNPVSPPTQQNVQNSNPPPPPPLPQQNIHNPIPPPPPPMLTSQPGHHSTHTRPSPVRKLPPQNNNSHGLSMGLDDIKEQRKKLKPVHINNSDSSKPSEAELIRKFLKS
ncbi:hypothetical protein SLOPH_2494, partial [Spraguea lophii 42_110]